MSHKNDASPERESMTDGPSHTEQAPPDGRPSDTTPPPTDESPASRKIPKKTVFFASLAILAILVFAICNADSLSQFFAHIGTILSPLLIGGVIAYLCNPLMRFFEYVVFRKMRKGALHSGLSLLLTVLTILLLLAGVVALIVPELIRSIEHLTANLTTTYIPGLRNFIDNILAKVNNRLPEGTDLPTSDKLLGLLGLNDVQSALSKAMDYLSGLNFNIGGSIWQMLLSIFTAIKNVILGIFIAIYLLASKEKRAAQIRKARAALLNEKQDRKLTEIVRLADKTFGGYTKGILLDALVVGVLTFLLLTIFRVSEYNLLIAAICAVTNIIPVFGPFIGAIPSALIVLISNPSKFFVFIILILIIQQIDGNIIVPRIQGSNTGISSLSVLIAITIMGSLFGIPGMIIGVPIFAVMIELIKRYLEKRLRKRGLATDTVAYYPSDAVGNAEEEIYYEHSHLRYWYQNSKLKKQIDRIRQRFLELRRKHAEKRQARKNAATSEEPPSPPENTDQTGE